MNKLLMEDANAINYQIKLTAGVFFAFLFFPVAEHFVFTGTGSAAKAIVFSRFIAWVEIALLIAYAKWVEKGRFFLWPPISYRFWFYPASFGALYLLTIASSTVSAIPKLFGLTDNEDVMNQLGHFVGQSMLLVALTAITAGVVEELIFRAYLVPRLEIVFKNKYMPVIVSASMFSALHLRYLSLHELMFTFFFGVVFAIHYQWYRNITILIITHAVIDFISLLLFGFVEGYKLSHHIIQR